MSTEIAPSAQTVDRHRDMLAGALLRLWRHGHECDENGSDCDRDCPHGEAERALRIAGILPPQTNTIEEEEDITW